MSRIRELLACFRARVDGPAGSTSIKPAAVAAELADLQLIDVREPGEWRSGHVTGAVSAWSRAGLPVVSGTR